MLEETLHPGISITGAGNVGIRYAYALIINKYYYFKNMFFLNLILKV